MNDAMAHVPLSSEGHIGIMTDGIPSMNACSCLDQLQVWRLLQCGGQVVCPEELNGGIKALLLDSEELPLWNATTTDEPAWDLPLIEVDLRFHPPSEQETHSAWRGQTWPSMIWGPPLCRHPHMWSHQKTSLASSKSVIHHPCLPYWEVQRWPASPPTPQSQTPSRANPADLTDEVFWLQGEMNMALEWLLITKATVDFHWRDLVLNANIAMCKNEAQATEAIRGGGLLCSHDQGGGDLLGDPCLHLGKIPQGKHARVGASGSSRGSVGLLSIPGGLQGSPVGLSTWSPCSTNVSLAAPYWQHAASHHLGDASYHLTTGYSRQGTNVNSLPTYSVRDTSTPNQNQMVVLLICLRSNHAETIGSCRVRHHSWRVALPKAERGEPLVRLLKESCWEALEKDSKLIRSTRWAYFKTHCPNYDHEGSNNLSHTYQGDGYLHWPSGLWCPWGSAGVDWLKRPLGCSPCSEKFPKGHPFLPGGASHWIAQDHGLKWNPFPQGPEMVKWSVLLPMVWEGQNEDMVVNHLWMSHYHLGLVCSQCLEYFTTSANTMFHHLQLCKPAPASVNDNDDDQEEESDIDDNGEDDNDFMFG